MSFEEKVKWLMNYLNHVYCDTCNAEYCEDCHRKYMNWGISEITAMGIVETLEKITE
jgi:hypothetical protein